MRIVAFAIGFLFTAAAYALVAHLWFNRPDPAMTESDALELFAYIIAIACVASSLVFGAYLWVSKYRPSLLCCFLYGIVIPVSAATLIAVDSMLLKPSPWSWFGSPLVPLAILVAVSVAAPWLANVLRSK